MTRKLNIGLFGFGCVGQGLYDVLSNSKGVKAEISRIAIRDPKKQRSLPEGLFTTDKDEILNDPEINLVVELIDDAKAAYTIVTEALKKGKNVVTANKKLVAEHLEELVRLQLDHNASLLYEASVCGAIPIIRTLEEYYDNEQLERVSGIFNGSSNYILSKIADEGLDYATALQQATDLGFAESDPTLDVEGFDAKYKLIILAAHSFGLFVKPEKVFNYGISNLSPADFTFAEQQNKKIRLIAEAVQVDEHEVALLVAPRLVDADSPFFRVNNEYNAVFVEANFSGHQLFRGKGAGGHPTGSAVLSDISANRFEYKYEYRKLFRQNGTRATSNAVVDVYLRYNDRQVLNALRFEQVINEGDHFIEGTISIAELLRVKQLLENDKSFVSVTGQLRKSDKAKVLTQFRKQPVTV